MINIWQKLKALRQAQGEPILILAPMADVTDSPFRQIVASCGKPDLFYTEFTSCEGLLSKGRDILLKNLQFTDKERPIIVQFFGSKPESFYKCAQLAVELGFDGIDINMGCPDRKVEKQGAGAALILNPKLAKEIIKETKRGSGDLPVSVKTRLGYNTNIISEWLPHLLESNLAAITIHGRTRKEMSSVPAHWEEIGKAVEMAKGSGTLIIGNGDVNDIDDAKQKAGDYNLDGIMVGRGIFTNPWFFSDKKEIPTSEDRINLMLEHTRLFEEFWQGQRNFDTMKKFFKVYISGPRFAGGSSGASWNGAKDLRIKLMSAKNSKDVRDIIDSSPV